MRDAMLLAGLLVAAYAGFGLLALSQPRSWERLGRPFRPGRQAALGLRAGGTALLGLSLLLAWLRDGPSFGILLWVVGLTLGALCTVASLTYADQARKRRGPSRS